MKQLTISLNPTYLCNFRCSFCYLTKEQLADRNTIDLSILEQKLKHIQESGYSIEHVDIYGGEIGLLPEDYLYEMDDILYQNGNPTINVITNLYKTNSYFEEPHVDLSVSFDFEAREKYEVVLQNILKSQKEIGVLMLASPDLLRLDIDKMIAILNGIQNIKTVEIKPYSQNQANSHKITDRDFENYVKKWITSSREKRFLLNNVTNIKRSLTGEYTAFSNNHIYITPTGKIAVLEFDNQDKEFFLEMDTMQEYESWVEKEKNRVIENQFCKNCEYLGKCLTEHYRNVKNLDESCNGYKELLDWSKNVLT